MFDFLHPSVPISKSFMRIPRISGIICGIWPQRKHSCIKLLFFGFNVFVVALGAVGENLYGFMYLNDLVNALEAFCPGVTKAISLLKMLVFFGFNHRWYMILQRIRTMLMAGETSSLAQNQRFRLQLTAVVKRHNAIIDLCSDFTTNFTLIILMHFLSAALVLCSSILDLMLNSASLGLLIYIFYSIAALTQLFLYCIGGSYISESSAAVADTLYDIEWYKCDVKTRKMILMMLRRSQKATTISVPFFTPSLSAFSSILSTTGSYIALLKTFL